MTTALAPDITALRQRCAWLVLATGLQVGVHMEALAVNKCEVGGKVTYQDAACASERETVADALAKKERYELLHRKLDRMAAQGHGMVQRAPPMPAPPPERTRDDKDDKFVPRPRSHSAEEERQARSSASIKEQTERNNAQSAAALTRVIDDAAKGCSGKMIEYPSVGMSDETFRSCTLHARFGGITQVVVSEDGKLPLRLYILPTTTASRVYSIGGVVTAVQP